MGLSRHTAARAGVAAAAAGAAAAAYMVFEAQWPACRQADLPVPGLPAQWSGVSILHLSDVHAGVFPTNERSLEKVVAWAQPLGPDLVFLTGDMLGEPGRSRRALDLLGRLTPPLGTFAVTGNHECGLSKGPLARCRDAGSLWEAAGVTLLRDSCVPLPARGSARLVLCGADYISGGFGLVPPASRGDFAADSLPAADFPVLLVHEPPPSDSALASRFALAFSGHTHGGQLRVPTPRGLRPLVNESDEFLSGVYEWGQGMLVVSRGVGTSFLPFRLLTRPEATLWRLV